MNSPNYNINIKTVFLYSFSNNKNIKTVLLNDEQ